ncbi:Crp/Fnr family transcriptional regulator [Alloiococcus sp. CFN-8]|uniref:Crp/Fnr family transcriptional regulator n=1 Tax=Alloiococcus sp. CFN-8 TaxID=3416081 RepID=UPI003CE79C8E
MYKYDDEIYKVINDCGHDTDNLPIVSFKKGDYVVHAGKDNDYIFYILEGKVKVVATASNGKKILVDDLTPGHFAGHLSNLQNKNFYCDTIAETSSILIKLSVKCFTTLMKNEIFARFYYCKVNERLYTMYKKTLVNKLFTQYEIIAYHILENREGNRFVCDSLYKACLELCISRRNLYYVLDKLKDEYILGKDEKGCYISDREMLMEIAKPVKDYYNNEY